MPAASERGPVPALPHTWRPFGVRMAGTVLGAGLLIVCALAWVGFDEETQARFTTFQRITVIALGLLAFAVWFALVRSRVVAEPDRLVVVNGYRRREYAWAQVVAVHLPPGAPWVTIDLADGSTVAAMGIQGSDGNRAKQAVRELRATVEHQSAP
ncbi:PH domain-containing protein [Nocardioides sp. MAH-18]|uniref:PH domain-containing protein n=1 Tax=Nocardioides agri TaxID=2682843 RepID=A0A6L6XKR7_9ACTN|nr:MULTISPECIES: PH domain-containing protein [unclassified Nocardioides]MBA2952991.1 PH domain-containing protein [Nocardioides sp. CGMCC 1.13656]MVQ47861.1 PH domain-containing protein [Nocardioides sp. MAH-18]